MTQSGVLKEEEGANKAITQVNTQCEVNTHVNIPKQQTM